MSKIGLSLSFCVRDIADGRIKERDVDKIYTSAPMYNKRDFEEVIEEYRSLYWKKYPDLAESIARRFYNSGRLEYKPGNISSGRWIEA